MSNGRLLELWNRKLAGEASPEEWQELQTLLSADPEAAERFRTLEQFWSRQDEGSPLSVEENLQKVLSDLGLSERAGERPSAGAAVSQNLSIPGSPGVAGSQPDLPRFIPAGRGPDDLQWAQRIYNWERNILYDNTTGLVYDNIDKDGNKSGLTGKAYGAKARTAGHSCSAAPGPRRRVLRPT